MLGVVPFPSAIAGLFATFAQDYQARAAKAVAASAEASAGHTMTRWRSAGNVAMPAGRAPEGPVLPDLTTGYGLSPGRFKFKPSRLFR